MQLQVKPGQTQDEQFEVERLRLGRPEQSDHQSAVITGQRGAVDAEEQTWSRVEGQQ